MAHVLKNIVASNQNFNENEIISKYFCRNILVINEFYSYFKVGHFPFTHVEFIDDGSIANEDVAESGS